MKQNHYSKILLFTLLLLGAWQINGQDLVAHYPFDGNTSDLANGNTATAQNVTLTQDRFGIAGQALLFDGVNSAVTAPVTDALLSDFTTISMWVKATTLPGQGEIYLISLGGWQSRFKVSVPSHGKPIWTTNADMISDMDGGDANALQVDTWTHLAFVHDGTKNKIFVNGALAAEKDVTGALNSTESMLGIGFDPLSNDFSFDGSIDEVRIYNGALSDQAIADLYTAQSTAPMIMEQMVASYSFSGNTTDNTDFGNTATATDISFGTDRHGFGHSTAIFNGMTSTVTAANSNQLNSDYTTVAMWVKVNALPAQGEFYLASFGGWQERWKISLPDHGKPVWTTNADMISDMDSGDANVLEPGKWTHLTFVHTDTTDLIYFDGALVAEKTVAGPMNSSTKPFGIGYNPIDNSNYFDGSIDEVKIFNYAVTPEAIADLYNLESMSMVGDDVTLVADFQMDGDATDASPFGNDGEVQGAQLTQNRFGYGASAYLFDENAAIEVANSDQYNSDFTTVSMWVRVDSLPAQGQVYIASFGDWSQRWKISLPDHGKPVWTTNADMISDMDSGDGNVLVEGEWKHVAFVHDGTKDKIFMNGALVADKDVAGALNSTDTPLGIGFNPVSDNLYFHGALDQFQIYNTALSDQEIADLYAAQSPAPVFTDSLVAYYPFSGNSDDVTPFNNNAEINGAVLSTDRFSKTNRAYSFDGIDDAITANNSTQLNSAQTSVSLWVNVAELPAQGQVYIASFGDWSQRWKISLPDHGKPVWTTNADMISDMDSGDGNVLVPGEWKHLVFTHDGTKDIIYMDGVSVAEKDVAGDLNSTTVPLGIGYNSSSNSSYFNGALDEFQVYNIALSAQQVADLYAAQSVAPMETDSIAPDAPLNLVAEAVFTDVNLSWSPANDNVAVTGYNVYQDSVKIQTVTSTSTSILGLAQLTEYSFGVAAIDAAGNESLTTNAGVTTGTEAAPDTIPPSVPVNLKIAAGSNSVIFSWDPSTDERAVAGYVVLVDGVLFDSLGVDDNSVLIGGLDAESFYTFEVAAFDLAGNLSAYAEITEATTAPLVTEEDGLVAHYPFDGDADDATPYNNHGVIGGDPSFETVADRLHPGGQAIVFDGDRDSVLAPNAVQLISDYTSISFWIRVDGQNFDDAEAYIMSFGHWDQRWKISLPQHLKVVLTTNSKNSQFDNAISDMDSGDGNELVKDFWWFVTMVHDGTDDIIYLDGKEVNRKPAAGTLNSTARPLGIGNNPIQGGQYFIGALDELKIYNRALTADEVENGYLNATTGLDRLTPEIQANIELVYPNPVRDEVSIKHRFTAKQNILIRIFDNSGRQVDHHPISSQDISLETITLRLGNYPAGFYQMNFVVDGASIGSVPFIRMK
ncbi:MAG: hypothetical protein Sapg2KO_16610 [Saprospiraceae bacterium]